MRTFQQSFLWAGRLFANCSKLPQKIATIVWHNKGAFRENGTDIPHNLRKVLPAKAHAGTFSCGCGRSSGAQQAHKKLSPVSMRGNSQNGGQTTKSLLTKPQCSGVPIQQAVSLSSSFPRHCLLFVCAFSLKCQKAQGRRNCSCPRSAAYKTAPASIMETGAVRLLYGYFFQVLTQNLARGLWVSPAYAGKRVPPIHGPSDLGDHPRVCGEKVVYSVCKEIAPGSPPHMRGKAVGSEELPGVVGITPAYAGKSAR